MSVWHQGRAVGDAERPQELDRGLLLGDGLFETVLVLGGRAQHLDLHLGRMTRSAGALGIDPPDRLAQEIRTAAAALWDADGRPDRGALRITLTRGAGRGLDPDPRSPAGLWISSAALGARRSGPVRAVVVDAPRIDPRDPAAGHKTTSYLPRVLARREARRAGAEIALLRTVEGDVGEADAANLFVVLAGRVVTPALDRGVLPGVTRARCLEALARAGLPFEEGRVAPEDLADATEIVVTASLDGPRRALLHAREDRGECAGLAAWLGDCLGYGQGPVDLPTLWGRTRDPQ